MPYASTVTIDPTVTHRINGKEEKSMGTFIDENNTGVVIDVDKCTQCLNCQLICSMTYEKVFNPTQARILIERKQTGEKYARFTDECTSCNICVDYCVYGALTLA